MACFNGSCIAPAVWCVLPILLAYLEKGMAITKEYCSHEDFKSDCNAQEVVMMTSALFGRYRLGRCIKADLGFLGCTNDVLQRSDKLCSGKAVCKFDVADEFHDLRPAACSELHMYLEASHTCIPITPVSYCHGRGPQHVAVTGPGHLSSQSVIDAGCGGQRAPLVLQAQPGQQLNLSIIDFGWSPEPEGECDKNYGYLVDKGNNQNMTLCGGGSRQHHLYESNGHAVELIITSEAVKNGEDRFLIQYEPLGCPDLQAPEYAWIKREGDDVTVGCEGTKQTWHLRCGGLKWDGVIGTCPVVVKKKEDTETEEEEESVTGGLFTFDKMPHDLLVTIVAAAALIISCFIACVGVVCYKYYKIKEARDKNYIVYNSVNTMGGPVGGPLAPSRPPSMATVNRQQSGGGGGATMARQQPPISMTNMAPNRSNTMYYKPAASNATINSHNLRPVSSGFQTMPPPQFRPRQQNDPLPDLMTTHNNLDDSNNTTNNTSGYSSNMSHNPMTTSGGSELLYEPLYEYDDSRSQGSNSTGRGGGGQGSLKYYVLDQEVVDKMLKGHQQAAPSPPPRNVATIQPDDSI